MTGASPAVSHRADAEPGEHDQGPLVSVITLCYDNGPYVVEALASIRKQTYRHVEVIVVDDGSTDDSAALVRAWVADTGFAAEVIEHAENRGIPAALNTALARARGEYVTVVCDDVWEPERLETVIGCFEGLPPNVGVLFGDAELIDAEGRLLPGALSPARTLQVVGVPGSETMIPPPGTATVISGPRIRQALYHRCFIPAPSITVRRSVYDLVGRYDEAFAIEDLDFYFRASEMVDFAYLRRPLVRYRRHDTNFTAGRSISYLQSLADVLDLHARSEPTRPSSQVKRHVREEAFRVTSGLLAAGDWGAALRTIRRFYLPRLQPTVACAKETARLGWLAAAGAARSLGAARNRRSRTHP